VRAALMTEVSKGERDEGSVPTPSDARQDHGPIVHEDLPDILEIFGAAPLVSDVPEVDEMGQDMAKWDQTDAHEDKQAVVDPHQDPNWDPMDSPIDEEALAEEEEEEQAEAAAGKVRAGVQDEEQSLVHRLHLAVEQSLNEMRDILSLNEDRLGRLEITLQSLNKQTNFLPPKLRGLGKKVDELTTSVGEARTRGLLVDIVGMGDLVEGALRSMTVVANESPAQAETRRYFEAMATRVEQILESHDIQEIPTDSEFDPTVHNAIEIQAVDDPDMDGQIVDVLRRGFRSEHSVLRYAEVTVGKYQHPDVEETDAEVESDDEDTRKNVTPITLTPFLGPTGTTADTHSLSKKATKSSKEQKKKQD
jgi:molecular chaperone GrpE (heat shock protein)